MFSFNLPRIVLALAALCVVASGCAHEAPRQARETRAAVVRAGGSPATAPSPAAVPAREPPEYLLHLPGIAGELRVDRQMIRGLREGGYGGKIEVYDWTGHDPLEALRTRARHRREARAVADKLLAVLRDAPDTRVTLVGHSGGAGIAVWALELLPEDARVENLLLLAPALSVHYDLSDALRRVRGKAYVFSSTNDYLVLGLGTRAFGTIDGLKEEAAGRHGFKPPPRADEGQYRKLVHRPYAARWMLYDNIGDHIGAMSPAFARDVLVPTLRGKAERTPDAKRVAASTRPSARIGAGR